MWGIPKIVLERLKGRTAGSQDDRHSVIDNRQSPHPDANLLAAFLERTLTERERTQVLRHLAGCMECREAAALTLTAETEADAPGRSPVAGGWNIRQLLRWGALAAALSAVVIVAVVSHHSRSRVQTALNNVSATVAANASETARQAPQPSPAQPTTGAAMRRAEAKSLGSAAKMAKLQKPAPAPLTQGLTAPYPDIEERALTPGASLRPPAAPAATPRSAQSAEVSAGRNSGLLNAAAQPSAVVEHPPVPRYVKGSSAGTAGASTAMRANALRARLPLKAFNSSLPENLTQPGALWSISPEGKLQRSADGGKNWEEVGVDDKVEFRAVQVNGREIWAGGTGGALYHSSDGGADWTRVNVPSSGAPTAETIVSINCSSSSLLQINVKTASGTQWVSDDGGQHWRAVASNE